MKGSYGVKTLNNKPQGIKTFIIALVLGAVIILPFVIPQGYLDLGGEYTAQTVPIYQLAHKAVRGGEFYWNWDIGLGASGFRSYAQVVFSPFFLLMLIFPTGYIPYLMAPIIVLKLAFAALSAYIYLTLFVSDKRNALVGGLMYGFSGWMLFNISFTQLQDIAVFFPLLLFTLENLITSNRKMRYGLALAACLLAGPRYVLGQLIFLALYIIVRLRQGGVKLTKTSTPRLIYETLLGLMLAGVAIVPLAAPLLVENSFTELIQLWWEQKSSGVYSYKLPAIFASFVLPPDIPGSPNLFSYLRTQWSSLSLWLPLFGVIGVVSFLRYKDEKPSWVKTIVEICGIIILVPAINSIFSGFDNFYYGRWFYMPILFLVLASILALEQSYQTSYGFNRGFFWAVVFSLVLLIAGVYLPDRKDSGGNWIYGLAEQIPQLWVWFGFSLGGAVVVFLSVKLFRRKSYFISVISCSLVLFIASFGIIYMQLSKEANPFNPLDSFEEKTFDLPQEPYARGEIYGDKTNAALYYKLPGLQVRWENTPEPLKNLYNVLGIKNLEDLNLLNDDYALRGLVSNRWLAIKEQPEPQSPLRGYQHYKNEQGYIIYENRVFLPMGFCYSQYIKEEELLSIPQDERSRVMLKGVVLSGEAIESNSDILTFLSEEERRNINLASYIKTSEMLANNTVEGFSKNKRGFRAESKFEKPQLVFFSVPYDRGWRAQVNGQPVKIYQANIGFMAVRVPKGECTITFSYKAPFLNYGVMISGIGLAIALLNLLWLITKRVLKPKLNIQEELLGGNKVQLSWEEYIKYKDKK